MTKIKYQGNTIAIFPSEQEKSGDVYKLEPITSGVVTPAEKENSGIVNVIKENYNAMKDKYLK